MLAGTNYLRALSSVYADDALLRVYKVQSVVCSFVYVRIDRKSELLFSGIYWAMPHVLHTLHYVDMTHLPAMVMILIIASW